MSQQLSAENRVERILDVASAIELRNYDEQSDYRLAQKWWMQYNTAYLERHLLPPTGLVAMKEGQPIAMVWIYLSNSKVAQVAWMVSDPNIGPKLKVAAMVKMMDMAEGLARSNGYKSVQIFSDRSAWSKVSQGLGFTKMRPHEFLVKSILPDDNDV